MTPVNTWDGDCGNDKEKIEIPVKPDMDVEEDDSRLEYLQELFQRFSNSTPEEYKRGDIVWGKVRGSSWWPAMIINADDCGRKKSNSKKQWLFWFGDHSISEVAKTQIFPFKENFKKNICTRAKKVFSQSVEEALLHCKKEFVKSVDEALSLLAKANGFKIDNISLISWACEGFESNTPLDFKWTQPDLPKFIQDALAEGPEMSEKSNNEDDPVKIVVKKVLNGEKSLEEVCIGCCRGSATLVQPHPLFIGKVCKLCKKDIDRVNNLACGKSYRYCIICGQGGNLVYCSRKICRRAFCEECINYLDSPKAFTKITSIVDWPCYLCKPSKRKNCLIQIRALTSKIRKPRQLSKSKPQKQSSTANKIAVLVDDIWKGRKKLEEVCIACCKENAQLVNDHPVFIGKVCKKCDKDVRRICNLLPGIEHNFCSLCGQGGFLVYCDNKFCLRSYCKPCINYLDRRKQACQRIVQKKKWACYFCKDDKNCLIQKRPADIPESPCASVSDVDETGTVSQWSAKSTPVLVNDSEDEFMSIPASASSNITDDEDLDSMDSLAASTSFKIASAKESLNYPTAISSYEAVPNSISNGKFIDEESMDYLADGNIPTDVTSNETAVVFNNLSDDDVSMDSLATPAAVSNEVSKNSHAASASHETSDIIQDILKGDVLLEDICISCRKKDVIPLMDHPLFEGQTCCTCNMIVAEVCNKMPLDERQNYCAICGKESLSLVKCGYYTCSRAYCKACVECLDSKDAYLRIAQNTKWLCYISQAYTFRSGKSLIRQRKPFFHQTKIRSRYRVTKTVDPKDLCIACGKSEFELKHFEIKLIAHHPLFFGSICESCEEDAEKACCLRSGKLQLFCILCGQGGRLIYCSEEACSRGYCEECIDYFDSDTSFNENAKESSWLCYYCKPSNNQLCLIQKRIPPGHFYYRYKPLKVYKSPPSPTEEIARKLHKGEISLQDVCIACFKEHLPHSEPHPLFKGIVCLECLSDVHRACDIHGICQDQCVVCGIGGNIIYCSNSLCSRAYCKTCIEYLDVKWAYDKIYRNECWMCYFCDLNPRKKCLLKRKADKRIVSADFPKVPKIKYPIVVLASNHTGLEALKKAKIKVKKFSVDSNKFKEINDSDLILGSYFINDETKVKDERGSLVTEFFKILSYFNTRRMTSCFQENVFFIFIGDYLIMDADILSQVANKFSIRAEFSPLLPVLFQFGERKFLAWSNLSACMPESMKKENTGPYIDKRKVVAGHFIDIPTVEKEIYYFFVKYLKDYFTREEKST